MKSYPVNQIVLVFMGLLTAAVAAETRTLKFDFGTVASPVFPGFVSINTKSLYRQDCGYGWKAGSLENQRDSYDRENYDDLCRDLIEVRQGEFIVDVKPGVYSVYFWIGDLYDRIDDLQYQIKVGESVLRAPSQFSLEGYSKLIFDNYKTEYHSTDNPWDQYISPRFTIRQCTVKTGGKITVTLTHTRICAMMVCSGNAEKVNFKEVGKINQQRRQQFEKNWKRVFEYSDRKDFDSSPVDQQRGYFPFTLHWMDLVVPETIPDKVSLCEELHVTAAQDEREPVCFGVYPLQDLKQVKINISSLVRQDGTILSAWDHEIRISKYRFARAADNMTYRVYPVTIDQYSEMDFESRIAQKIWIDVHVHENAEPGKYSGLLTFGPANKPSYSMKFTVSVLPFKLLTDTKRLNYSMQYLMPIQFRPFRDSPKYMSYIQSDYQFMEKFGLTMPTLGYDNSYPRIQKEPSKSQGWTISLDQMKKNVSVLSTLKKFSERGILYCMYGMTLDGYYILPPKKDELGYPVPDQNDNFWFLYHTLVDEIQKKQKEGVFPGIIYLLTAEMSNQKSNGIQYGRKIHEIIHSIPDIRTASMVNSREEMEAMADVSDIIGLQVPLCTKDNMAYVHNKNPRASIWFYQPANRMSYGYYYYKAGFTGSFREDFQYVYVDPYNGFDGSCDEIFGETIFSLPAPEGSVPTIKCYEFREGIDDAKYLYTLEKFTFDALNAKSPECRKAGRQAETVMGQIMGHINPDLTYYDEVGFWDNPAYDKLRRRVADEIVKLADCLKAKESL